MQKILEKFYKDINVREGWEFGFTRCSTGACRDTNRFAPVLKDMAQATTLLIADLKRLPNAINPSDNKEIDQQVKEQAQSIREELLSGCVNKHFLTYAHTGALYIEDAITVLDNLTTLDQLLGLTPDSRVEERKTTLNQLRV